MGQGAYSGPDNEENTVALRDNEHKGEDVSLGSPSSLANLQALPPGPRFGSNAMCIQLEWGEK